MNILVAEPLTPAGLEILKSQTTWNVIVADPKTYAEHLATADALLVRSAVRVTADVLKRAPRLRVIGRAGVGVDNVDLQAATAAGVLVMNTPGGNAVAVAEQTMGFMLSMARHIPQATASTKAGKWEKKKFVGSELRGKTLGIIGLGAIGREVVIRARGFGMKIVAYDPYVSHQTAADLNVDLLSLDELYGQADYITIHVASTPETHRMINAAAIAKMKKGVRFINCARGELVNHDDLLAALQSGAMADAALDVFDPEPLAADHPLLAQENLIATPHTGASTEEAQEIVGVRICEQVAQYLIEGVAINAVNMPALTPEAYKSLGPYITLAERLGLFASYISEGNLDSVKITYWGRIAEHNTQLIRNAVLAGILNRSLSQRANLVNAMQIAGERGFAISEKHEKRVSHIDAVEVEIATAGTRTTVEGAVVLDKPRLIRLDGIYCEAMLDGRLVYMKNNDVPGVIGQVGTVLGQNGINIAHFSLGRQDEPDQVGGPLTAIAVVEVDGEVPETVLNQLRALPAVRIARVVTF